MIGLATEWLAAHHVAIGCTFWGAAIVYTFLRTPRLNSFIMIGPWTRRFYFLEVLMLFAAAGASESENPHFDPHGAVLAVAAMSFPLMFPALARDTRDFQKEHGSVRELR